MIAVLVITMLCSLASVGIVVASYFVKDLTPISFAYLLVGEAIIPIELLVNGDLGAFYVSTMNIVSICVSLAIFVLCILAIREFSRIGRKDKKGKRVKVKHSFVGTMIISIVLMGYYTFNAIMTYLNYLIIRKYLRRNLSGIVEKVVEDIGKDALMIKFFVICALIVGLAFIIFILNFICKEKGEVVIKGNKTVVQELTFYSDEFIKNEETQTVQVQETRENKEEIMSPIIKKKESEDLIMKIMQLNELKNSGQINEVEYTRLRQKAIRRYRG